MTTITLPIKWLLILEEWIQRHVWEVGSSGIIDFRLISNIYEYIHDHIQQGLMEFYHVGLIDQYQAYTMRQISMTRTIFAERN